jgi:hypothetical protein
MSRKMIPVEESFAAWRKDPEYQKGRVLVGGVGAERS